MVTPNSGEEVDAKIYSRRKEVKTGRLVFFFGHFLINRACDYCDSDKNCAGGLKKRHV